MDSAPINIYLDFALPAKFVLKRIENNMGKGKILLPAFSPIPTLVSKGFFSRVINPFQNKPWFLWLQYKSFENTVGKGEIALN